MVTLADFFALQDRITESVIAAIEPQIYAAEHHPLRSRPPESLDAWGFVMQAMPYVWTWGPPPRSRPPSSARPGARHRSGLSSRQQPARMDQPPRSQLGWADAGDALPPALAVAQRAIAARSRRPLGPLGGGLRPHGRAPPPPAVDELNEAIERNPSLAFAM